MDRKKLALIHILKKELNLADEEYRSILRTTAGVSSSKDLDEPKFRKLMRYFVRSRFYVLNRSGLTIKQKLYIDHLRKELGWTDDHFANFLRKYYRKTSLLALTKADAGKVIVALKHILQHTLREAAQAEEDPG
jgi:hypothetical protein